MVSHNSTDDTPGPEGMVFDVREFAVHDGPGIRTTVFLKGCPLRCAWCHNPESFSRKPQTLKSPAGERTVGRMYRAAELAERLLSQADVLRLNGGGITFSGGEPLLQADFVVDVIDRLGGLHTTLDTSGQVDEATFQRVASRCDLVLFDIKLVDSDLHRRYTGIGNERIRANIDILDSLAVPFVIRVPLVPTVTDTPENLQAIATLAKRFRHLERVDLLPYNMAAGGKYAACGLEFQPSWDENLPVRADTRPFQDAGVPVLVR